MSDSLTERFYDDNADAFFQQTVAVDMRPLHQRFLEHVPQGGYILDAGCGSGRDAKAFRDLGYRVAAFDASPALAARASVLIGETVMVRRFDEIDFIEIFDAVWACASLLHVPSAELSATFRLLAKAVRDGGIIYASFKAGNGQRRDQNGRHFTDMTEGVLASHLSEIPTLQLLATWHSCDQRPGRASETWLNVLLKKVSEVPSLKE